VSLKECYFESKSIGKKNVYRLQGHQAAGRGARHLLEKPETQAAAGLTQRLRKESNSGTCSRN
jgi:hypothetical protein